MVLETLPGKNGLYEDYVRQVPKAGYQLLQAGVVSGYDSTTESAVTKLMFLLGHGYTPDEVRDRMNRSMAGEITL